ncbi:bacteriocin fulvocin C-related protein [Saccharothrix australiensis]|uniref:Uncharacterized protein n=1 Tax=Saccharothrix australiensis TaxID=2072 RepID=A0A495W2K4_9PSEU|nr:bacteriocin fulvocin C-related protein [Saccharothrix australiensis]RKT55699.1 hypothetical protein C8E97_4384 [Saccharothrix australiensis]
MRFPQRFSKAVLAAAVLSASMISGAAAAIVPPASTGASPVADRPSRIPEGEPTCGAAQAWVQANKERLPTDYDSIVEHSMVYRRAIFAALPAESKAQFWRNHLRQYRQDRPELSTGQHAVLDHALSLLDREDLYAAPTPGADVSRELDSLKNAAVREFGRDEARSIVATLGPPEQVSPAAEPADEKKPLCTCSIRDDWCTGGTSCRNTGQYECDAQPGCGTLGAYTCTGQCGYNLSAGIDRQHAIAIRGDGFSSGSTLPAQESADPPLARAAANVGHSVI